MMVRHSIKYYEAHAQTISLLIEEITSSDNNADIIQRLRANDPTFKLLQISGERNFFSDDHDFIIDEGDDDEGDDLGWLGYFVGNSSTLENLGIYNTPFLSANRLGDFIEGLSRNRSMQILHIGVDLGSACFRQMGDFFKNHNNLRELSFGDMDTMGVESARSIAFMLNQCERSNLRKICFEQSGASEEVLTEIVTAISTHSQLQVLNLGENNLGRDGSVALGKALKACDNPRLQKLVLCFNSIDDEGLRALVDGMQNCHSLTELDLEGNDLITADGFSSLSTLFQSEHCHLKHLDVSYMNMGDVGVVRTISTGLASLTSLEKLHFSGNSIGDDGARALGAELVNLRSLEDLNLGDNSIGDVGASALAAGLVNLRSLEDLNLGENSIGDDGARALAAGLKNLQSLETLNLSSNSIGSTGATAIGAGLKSLQSLKTLFLYSNSIGDGGSAALAAGLVNLHSLEKIYLGANSIGDLGVQALVEGGLVHCDNLQYLCLSSNVTITASGLSSMSTILQSERCSLTEISIWDIPFGDDGAVALADVLKGNKSMKQLRFDPDSARVTSVGWPAFSKLLCDTSSVNATYLSNHSLEAIGEWNNGSAPNGLKALLVLNKHEAEHVAIHKILNSHYDFDVEPFFEWKLKLLPLVISWFERVRTLVDENSWMSDGSVQNFQSRKLSAMYNFVRGMPLLAIDGYCSRNVAVLAPSRKRKIEQLVDES
ncbi:hypothetical protein ACHAWC_010847 [Mediolabrus comicus]